MTKKFGIRKNPKTGMTETYELPDPINLERSRKEFRDFIHGNIEWHDDPYAAPAEKPVEVDMDDLDNQYADFYNNYSADIS